MFANNNQYNQTDSFSLKTFDAKDDGNFITLKTDVKEWMPDSMLGQMYKYMPVDTNKAKLVKLTDTLKPAKYFIYKEEVNALSSNKSYVKSIFAKHNLHTNFVQPKFKVGLSNDWGLGIFLLSFSLLAIANVYYIKRFNLFTKAFFFQRFTAQLMREDNSQTQRLTIVLSSVYLISVSLFAVRFNDIYQFINPEISHLTQFFLIVVAVLSFFVFKVLLNHVIGIIFRTEKEINEYVFTIVLMNQFLGIALLTLCFLLFYAVTIYSKIILGFGLFLILGIYIYRVIRGIFTTHNNKNISKFYLFLYFCTLEILPLVLITKLMLD